MVLTGTHYALPRQCTYGSLRVEKGSVVVCHSLSNEIHALNWHFQGIKEQVGGSNPCVPPPPPLPRARVCPYPATRCPARHTHFKDGNGTHHTHSISLHAAPSRHPYEGYKAWADRHTSCTKQSHVYPQMIGTHRIVPCCLCLSYTSIYTHSQAASH